MVLIVKNFGTFVGHKETFSHLEDFDYMFIFHKLDYENLTGGSDPCSYEVINLNAVTNKAILNKFSHK